MAFDWEEFLLLSRALANQPNTEPHYEGRLRTAVSRAYYAAFCTARDYLLVFEKISPAQSQGRDIHHIVKQYFQARSDKVSSDIADHLQFMLKLRQRADYYTHYELRELKVKVKECLWRAGQVIHQIRQLEKRDSNNSQ
jgi:uncharacterized protein (UPF0332 family)